MKNLLLVSAAAFGLAAACAEAPRPVVMDEGLKFSESTLPYDGGMLVASFGCDELNPLNAEGRGYVMMFKDGRSEVFVPADGSLSAPKGMLVDGDRLFVCDVNRIVVYDLQDRSRAPQVIEMGEGNLFVNDLVAHEGMMYVSVTNSDKVLRMDISSRDSIGAVQEWLSVPGPNGLAVRDGRMYIASYPASGVTSQDNVLYVVDDLSAPQARKLTDVPGQYDGIAFSEDGAKMYFTNWAPAGVSVMDMATGEVSSLEMALDVPLSGPADISVKDGRLYIPDLPASRVVVVDLK